MHKKCFFFKISYRTVLFLLLIKVPPIFRITKLTVYIGIQIHRIKFSSLMKYNKNICNLEFYSSRNIQSCYCKKKRWNFHASFMHGKACKWKSQCSAVCRRRDHGCLYFCYIYIFFFWKLRVIKLFHAEMPGISEYFNRVAKAPDYSNY